MPFAQGVRHRAQLAEWDNRLFGKRIRGFYQAPHRLPVETGDTLITENCAQHSGVRSRSER